MADATKFYGTGRRKNAVAKVWLTPGNGNFAVNKRDLGEYFGKKTLEMIVRQPLELTSTLDKYDVSATVRAWRQHRSGRRCTSRYSRALVQG